MKEIEYLHNGGFFKNKIKITKEKDKTYTYKIEFDDPRDYSIFPEWLESSWPNVIKRGD